MEIAFIYPNLNSSEYVGSLELINDDIGKENSKLIIPNTFVYLVGAVFIGIWAFVYRGLFFYVTRKVTASGLSNIVTGLFLYVISGVILLYLIILGIKKLRPLFLKAIKLKEAEESYSLSEYVERKDSSKKAKEEVAYYKMCDLLKKSKVTDATAVCDGSRCKVEVAYESSDDSGVFTFYLPYHEKSDLDRVIVDFSRKCVLFPKEEE